EIDGVKPLGTADAGPATPVGIRTADARHHVHIVGATGSGKTTLMLSMILSDVAAGRGVVLIDPKGDAVLDLLQRPPASLASRLFLFHPAAPAPPPVLNVLQTTGRDTDVVTDNIVGIFRRLFSSFWGPRTDDIFRAACLTLLADPRRGASGAVTLEHIP